MLLGIEKMWSFKKY